VLGCPRPTLSTGATAKRGGLPALAGRARPATVRASRPVPPGWPPPPATRTRPPAPRRPDRRRSRPRTRGRPPSASCRTLPNRPRARLQAERADGHIAPAADRDRVLAGPAIDTVLEAADGVAVDRERRRRPAPGRDKGHRGQDVDPPPAWSYGMRRQRPLPAGSVVDASGKTGGQERDEKPLVHRGRCAEFFWESWSGTRFPARARDPLLETIAGLLYRDAHTSAVDRLQGPLGFCFGLVQGEHELMFSRVAAERTRARDRPGKVRNLIDRARSASFCGFADAYVCSTGSRA
jgi:hypothetical protein